ncbi:MAG: hypothetical protein QXE19_05700 [Candidatus Bathyarchaeia archaeon]
MVLDWFVIGGAIAATVVTGITGAAIGYHFSKRYAYAYPYFWYYRVPAYYYYRPILVPYYLVY